MRTYARVLLTIWRDKEFVRLPAAAQRLYLMLISQPDLSTCGVVPYSPRRWARFAPDTTVRGAEAACQRLVADRFTVVDENTDEVLIRTYIRHAKIEANPNHVAAARGQFDAVVSPRLRAVLIAEYPAVFDGFTADADALPEQPQDALWDSETDATPNGIPDGIPDGVLAGESLEPREEREEKRESVLPHTQRARGTSKPEQQVFDAWIDHPNLTQHKKRSTEMTRRIHTRLADHSVSDLIDAVDLYATCLQSPQHYWTHQWTLSEFMQRGVEKFLPESQPLTRYRIRDADRASLNGRDATPAPSTHEQRVAAARATFESIRDESGQEEAEDWLANVHTPAVRRDVLEKAVA